VVKEATACPGARPPESGCRGSWFSPHHPHSWRTSYTGEGRKAVAMTPPTPTALPVQPDTIPQELKALPQWVCWRYVLRDDKWTKQPVSIHTGDGADSTDPTTWASFEHALTLYQKLQPEGLVAGLGFVFADEADPSKALCGLDLDKCRD